MQWIKIWTNKWFTGSTRWELTPEERSVWIDFLARAAQNEIKGQIDFFSLEQLATYFNVPILLLRNCISKFIKFDKILVENNTIYIQNWLKYQTVNPTQKVNIKKHKKFKNFNIKKHTKRREEKIRIDKNRIDKNNSVSSNEETASSSHKNNKKTKQQLDEDFILALKSNPAYKEIDIDRELAKMDAWLLLPRARGRKKTKRFIINWLNKIDIPITEKRAWEE